MAFNDRLIDFLSIGPMGQVPLELVPEEERRNFRFWRATSVAKLALVFESGKTTINLGTDPAIHFFDNYDMNSAYSDALLWGDTVIHSQLKASDMRALTRLTGRPLVRQHLPRIVFALDQQFNDLSARPSTIAASPGVDLGQRFDISDIDPYSREFLEELLLEPSPNGS